MENKKIVSVQDLSCYGQCSLTVALPVLSACGVETAILPSGMLSTHTAGFKDFTVLDLTDEMKKIIAHWKKENLQFDAIYTGYICSAEQIEMVIDLANTLVVPGGEKIVDPAMADHGSLYFGFDDAFVAAMTELVKAADVVLPNITEAAFITGSEYKDSYDEAYINELADKLHALGPKKVILTGVSYDDATTGILVSINGEKQYYRHEKMPKNSHGTGDIYSSAFVGAYLQGKSEFESAKIAADYTLTCMKNTQDDESHWYGVKFEPVLGELVDALR